MLTVLVLCDVMLRAWSFLSVSNNVCVCWFRYMLHMLGSLMLSLLLLVFGMV